MNPHDFSKSLDYEKSKFAKADHFYKTKFGAADIQRADFESETGKQLQRMDVDVSFTYNGRKIFVSEKDRKADYGDLLLEFYSKFPDKKGWMDFSQADFIAYFVPGKVYWINKKQLIKFYLEALKPQISDRIFRRMIELFPQASHRKSMPVKINGKEETVEIVQAYNAPEKSFSSWYTESVCVKISVLREAGIEIEEFSDK